MSVSLPQFKNVQLTTKDFTENTYDEGYDANGVVLPSVADFYTVSKEDKEILFTLHKGFHDVSQKMMHKEITVPQYLAEIGRLNDLTKQAPNITIELNDKNVFVISLAAELKYEYQTVFQQAETNAVKAIKAKKPTIFSLYAVEWEESERGWGVRPDGFTFHTSAEEAKKFVKDFVAKQPQSVPDEYSRPSGEAKLIEVSESLHDYVVENGSVWLGANNKAAYKTYDASVLKKPKKKI